MIEESEARILTQPHKDPDDLGGLRRDDNQPEALNPAAKSDADKGDKKEDTPKAGLGAVVMTYVVPAAFVLVGVLVGAVLTYFQQRSSATENYRLQFAGTIRDAAPSLGNDSTAATTYAGLFALAGDNDLDYKRILVVIGALSRFPTVKTTLAEFIDADPETKSIANGQEIQKLMQGSATISSNNTSSSKGSPDAAGVVPKATPDAGQVALLHAAIPTGSGWLYYGRTGVASKDPVECVDATSPIPAKNSSYVLCGSRYLRDKPSVSGSVITGLPAQTKVTVVGDQVFPLSKDSKAVWLEVDHR